MGSTPIGRFPLSCMRGPENGFVNASRIERNIPKQYLFTFLSGTRLTESLWMLYLAFRGIGV